MHLLAPWKHSASGSSTRASSNAVKWSRIPASRGGVLSWTSRRQARRQLSCNRGGASSGRRAQTYNTRVQSKVRSLANLAAASATCQPAAAARRSQARRGAHPPQGAIGGNTEQNCSLHAASVRPFRIRIYRNMMLDSTVVCRRALGCEWGGNTELSCRENEERRSAQHAAALRAGIGHTGTHALTAPRVQP